jgi:hypothetical protein
MLFCHIVCILFFIQAIPYAKYRRKNLFYIAVIVIVIFIGSMFYMYNEDWSFVNALYFSFIATLVSKDTYRESLLAGSVL